jgi:hypothetical protein
MPIHVKTWCGRLTTQLPGWYFWYAEWPDRGKPWHAVPAPGGGRVRQPYRRPGRIDAATPQELRERCQQGSRPDMIDSITTSPLVKRKL